MLNNNNILEFTPKIPGWLTEKEMQELTGFRTTKLWQLRSKGQLIASKIGNRTFYKQESLLELLENNIQISPILRTILSNNTNTNNKAK